MTETNIDIDVIYDEDGNTIYIVREYHTKEEWAKLGYPEKTPLIYSPFSLSGGLFTDEDSLNTWLNESEEINIINDYR